MIIFSNLSMDSTYTLTYLGIRLTSVRKSTKSERVLLYNDIEKFS